MSVRFPALEDRRPQGDGRRRAPRGAGPGVVRQLGGGPRGRGRARRGRRRGPPGRATTRRPAPSSAIRGAPTSSSRSRRRRTRRRPSSARSVLIGFLAPLTTRQGVKALAATGVTELRDGGDPAHHPRPGDGRALLAGERRRLPRGADRRRASSGRFFPMMTTAAGTSRRPRCSCSAPASPACRRSRPPAPRRRRHRLRHPLAPSRSRSQSLGAPFLEVEVIADAEGEGGYARAADRRGAARRCARRSAEIAGKPDVIITTALIPGRPAPMLITARGGRAT